MTFCEIYKKILKKISSTKIKLTKRAENSKKKSMSNHFSL